MRKLLILSLIIFWHCNEKPKKNIKSVKKITISKVEGSPSFDEAKLSLSDSISKKEGSYSFSFNVDEYNLGDQTSKNFNYKLANSDKGQHIHLIINNGPYFAKYSNNFDQKLEEENNVILAFLSRSYHESVKNPNAYFLTKIGKNNKIDLNNQLLFYSRPKGTYEGEATKKLLLDFYLINTKISSEGNKVRATIEDTEFLIDEWAPYYIEGLPMGEVSIKLELIDSNGELIKTPFNPSIRKVFLK
ncbi:MAG: hypothetical protein CBC76_03985 [Flavobacteriaceae bacterium TMED116]|nr:hypothetical protein [Flavobacteriaceae bacterium]OUV49650.1 MAG: hypothetical protein CBC76_03985 [Flavobacteriaceae bacterium TMED116]|tara:strand:+ start:6521 stop:7255 length:735 start_codon:yes stop_codon:yes gene_type:complete